MLVQEQALSIPEGGMVCVEGLQPRASFARPARQGFQASYCLARTFPLPSYGQQCFRQPPQIYHVLGAFQLQCWQPQLNRKLMEISWRHTLAILTAGLHISCTPVAVTKMVHTSANYSALSYCSGWLLGQHACSVWHCKIMLQSLYSTTIQKPTINRHLFTSCAHRHPCMHSHTADVVTAPLYAASCVPF